MASLSVRFILISVMCGALCACGGGGGGTKPSPMPSKTCAERLGTGAFVTSTVTNPSVTDSTCPSGQTLAQSGISNTSTTTTYSCPSPASISDPVASSTTSAPVVTQAKICTTDPVVLTCAQKLGTGSFVNSSQTSSVSDNSCPTGQHSVQDGISQTTISTTYSCPNPSSAADPVSSTATSSPVLTRPKMCNFDAPINYSTYFRDKTGVTQANAAGFTGKNVKIVIYDEAFNVNNPALAGRISQTFGTIIDNADSHGTSTAAIAAGSAVGILPGGVAQESILAISDWDADIQPIINWGARVYNFSFGYEPESAGASQADINQYVTPWVGELRAIRDSGAFIAISAGNDELSSVQILAGTTAFYPDITNILAVAAMSPLNGTLSPYSNKCGDIAKNFCITAPGTVNLVKASVNQGDVLTDASYEWFAGTSAAAPIVSGIAALVYQAFPGFTGTQVRDTLISTASDIGELGNDAVYGVGLVNAQKAVLGPAKLSLSFMAAVPEGVTWNFGNDIDGDGGIIKEDGGGLSLTGNNTYTGGTEIRAGKLNLLGQIIGEVRLNGGTLFANGDVYGNVQANAGTLLLSSGDVFQVHGNLNLAGSALQLDMPAGYANQWQGTLIEAMLISGASELVAPSAWFSVDSRIADQQLVASLQRKAVTEVLSENSKSAQNTAANLETAFVRLDAGEGSQALKQTAALLQATTQEQAKLAFSSLSGQSQTTAKDIALEAADALQPLLTERLFDLAHSSEHANGAWLMFANPSAEKRSNGFLATDIHANLVAAGVDHQWDGMVLGAALFAADDRAEFEGVQDSLNGKRQGLSLYARRQGEDTFVQGFAYLSQFSQRSTRTLTVGESSSVASSRSEGASQGLSLEVGKALNAQLTLAVQASADWVQIDAYDETGVTGFELRFKDGDLSRYLLGPDIRYQSAARNGFSWNAQLGYRYVLNDVNTDMLAAYSGLPDNPITVAGMPYSQDFFNAALGLGYQTGKAFWYLRGDFQQADDAQRGTLSAGVRIGF